MISLFGWYSPALITFSLQDGWYGPLDRKVEWVPVCTPAKKSEFSILQHRARGKSDTSETFRLGALMLSSRKIDLKEETRRSSVRKKENLKTSEMNNTKSVEISTNIGVFPSSYPTPQYHVPICGVMQLPSYCFEPPRYMVWYQKYLLQRTEL